MAANTQKLKVLYLMRMLFEETDATQGLTMNEILERLEAKGITAERKSIYRDLETLQATGMQVVKLPTAPTQYAVTNKGFTKDDVTLLVDAVQSCRFLSEQEADRLVEALRGLVSERQRGQLEKQVHVDDRVDGRGDVTLHNVDIIHQAIRQHKKIGFANAKLDTSCKPQLTHSGKYYVVTPVALSFSDGFYYLSTYLDNLEDFRSFRVDRMRLLEVKDDPATRNAAIANHAFEKQGYKMFHGLGGTPLTATLKVKEGFMDAMADTFGLGLTVVKATPQEATIRVNVQESDQFYGWLAGVSAGVTPEGPGAFVTRYKEWLKGLC